MAIVGSLMQIAFWAIVIPTAFYLLTQLAGNLIYAIGIMFFKIMDLLQSTFRKLAGLGGNITVAGEKSDDLVTALLSNRTIIDMLISVTVFAIGLIIVASIVQMIRLEYTTEGSKNSKEQIFAKAGKALIMFILIPIMCFVGIRVSNYLLVAVDYATSSAGASTVSGCIFASASADASKIYDDKNAGFHIDITNLLGSLIMNAIPSYGNAQLGGSSGNYYVEGFDKWFSSNATSESEARADLANQVSQSFTMATTDSSGMLKPGRKLNTYSGSPWKGTFLHSYGSLSYTDVNSVYYFYNISNINYLILFLGCYFGIKTLFTACMGLIARLYKLAALFIISPAAIGLQPLDDGAAYKKWRGEFIKNVLSCYGIIVALNLYFVIVGVLQTVELWPGWLNYIPNKFVQFMMVLTGATMINDLAGTLGSLIGAGDVMADGAKATSEVGKLASGVAKVGMGAMGGAAKAIGGKLKAAKAQGTKSKDGKMSFKEAQRSSAMSDDDITEQAKEAQEKFKKETDGFVQQPDGSWAKTTTGKNGKTKTKTMSKEDYDKKKAAADANTEDALKKKREESKTALATDENFAQASTKVAQGRAQAMMGRAAVGQALNPMKMLGGVDNLLGGVSKYVSGEAFKASDEKYLEELEKQGVDTKALGLEAGKTGPLDTVNKGLGGVFGLKKKKADWQTSRVQKPSDLAQEINTNRDMIASADAALGKQQEEAENNATQAAEEKKKLSTKNANVGNDAGYQTANANGVKALEEFNKAMETFASGGSGISVLKTAAGKAMKDIDGGGGDTAENDAAKKMIQDVLDEALKHGTNSDAQRQAVGAAGAKFDNATITATMQDANSSNVAGGYGTTAERTAYQSLSEAETAANNRASDIKAKRENLVNESANAAANAQQQKTDDYGRPVVDKDGKPVMESANFSNEFAKQFAEALKATGMAGGDKDAYESAMKNLAKTLKDEGIKAKLDGLDESKFKIEDSNIIKNLKDILAAIQATKEAKKDDKSEKTLTEILKQLKKNGGGKS